MSNEIISIKEKIAAHKPIALTRKQKLAARDELKRLTEQHAPKVIETLAGFVKDRKIPASSRVAAGNLLLERYAGRSGKPEDEKTLESEYSKMSEGQLLGAICESIWGLSSNARAAIAETIVAAEQGVKIDTEQLAKDLDEEAAEIAKMEKPKKVPRR